MATKAQTAVKDATKTIEDAIFASKDTMEQAFKASTEGYEQVVSASRAQCEKASKAMLGGYDDIASASKDNMDALIAAGDIWFKGYEKIGKACFAYAQETAELGAEAAKAVMAAKTVQDVIDLQTEFAKQRLDSLTTEGAKLSEMSVKTVNEAMAPIQKRFDENVSKFMKTAAV
jgi:phasin family protein